MSLVLPGLLFNLIFFFLLREKVLNEASNNLLPHHLLCLKPHDLSYLLNNLTTRD